MGSDASSVWNFCARFSDVIWRGNQWWRRQMSAVFSGQVLFSNSQMRINLLEFLHGSRYRSVDDLKPSAVSLVVWDSETFFRLLFSSLNLKLDLQKLGNIAYKIRVQDHASSMTCMAATGHSGFRYRLLHLKLTSVDVLEQTVQWFL